VESDVRYCTTEDGVRIAYCVVGDGPPLLLCHAFWAFSVSHISPSFEDALRQIGRGRALIRYDARGTGLSQPDVEDVSPEAMVRDVVAVVDSLDLARFHLMGAALGGFRAIEYAARQPARVAGLVLYDTFARLQDSFPKPFLEALAQLSRANWQFATRTMSDAGILRNNPKLGLQWAEIIQNSLPGETMARLIESHMDVDANPFLPQVRCPTVVCHSRRDPLYPYVLGRRLAEAIPNAQLVPIDAEGGPFMDPAPVVEAMDAVLPPIPSLSLGPGPASVPTAGANPLTPRETEILRMIASGETSKEISRRLNLSVRTVGRHITNIYDKIGARGRADAAAWALRQGPTEE
jgi:pimeloyl-ACP methyl ester carboxylesterase/DNA-binding CsgD family transcriptional regulator